MFEVAVIIIAIALLPLAFGVVMGFAAVIIRVALPVVLVVALGGGLIWLGMALVEESKGQGAVYWVPFGLIGLVIALYVWGELRWRRAAKRDRET